MQLVAALRAQLHGKGSSRTIGTSAQPATPRQWPEASPQPSAQPASRGGADQRGALSSAAPFAAAGANLRLSPSGAPSSLAVARAPARAHAHAPSVVGERARGADLADVPRAMEALVSALALAPRASHLSRPADGTGGELGAAAELESTLAGAHAPRLRSRAVPAMSGSTVHPWCVVLMLVPVLCERAHQSFPLPFPRALLTPCTRRIISVTYPCNQPTATTSLRLC